jgi:hypothetical protein
VIDDGCEAGQQYLQGLTTALALLRGLVLALNNQVSEEAN